MSQTPTAAQIKSARASRKLSQADAAALIYKTRSAWAKWESGSPMDPALWELFLLKLTSL